MKKAGIIVCFLALVCNLSACQVIEKVPVSEAVEMVQEIIGKDKEDPKASGEELISHVVESSEEQTFHHGPEASEGHHPEESSAAGAFEHLHHDDESEGEKGTIGGSKLTGAASETTTAVTTAPTTAAPTTAAPTTAAPTTAAPTTAPAVSDKDEILSQILTKLEKTEARDEEINDSIENDPLDQSTLNRLTGEQYMLWDDLLNDVWAALKKTKSASEMEKLTKEERQWIKDKEAAIKEAGADWAGGSGQPMVENGTGASWTRQRVYELIEELQES